MSTTSSSSIAHHPYCSAGVQQKLLAATGLPAKEALLKLLSDEPTLKAISLRTQINRTQLYQALAFFAIPIPRFNRSEQMRDWYQKQPPGTSARLTGKAHAAVRGKRRSHTEMVRRAQMREQRPFLREGEKAVVNIFESHHIDHVPQMAADRWNIDVAFPHINLAVEINGGHWHDSDAHRKRDQLKRKYLESHGWRVVYLWGSRAKISAAAEALARQISQSPESAHLFAAPQ
jgi:very-short-patch-repair endonuclease